MSSTIKEKIGNWMIAGGRSLLVPQQRNREAITARVDALRNLWFLADAPMFIDGPQVERLFEAIFQPEYEAASRTSSREDSTSQELGLELAASGEVSVPTIFKVSTGVKASEKSGKENKRGESIVENAVKSSERRLEKLFGLYVYSYPERLFWIKSDLISVSRLDGVKSNWAQIEETLDQPGIRPLVVFDLDRDSKLIPMFAELNNGKAINLYDQLIDSAAKEKKLVVPDYPLHGTENYEKRQQEYWSALSNAFDSNAAMVLVEKSTTDIGRIEWIDYRLVGFDGERPVAIHVHVVARGQYSTGTFAYQLIRRGEKHGVRIVGTLKKGHDVNVLAIYER